MSEGDNGNGRIRAIGIVFLGVLALLALAFMGIVSAAGRDIPPVLASAFGTSVGALAGILSPSNRQG